jgi:NADH:ubiquinone oxidoreductase subunit F (NADH-binding)/NADH:ubiquinone oxidoreductase subunit E
VPGQTVSELERRYGRRGDAVLARLREAKAARGRIDSLDVEGIAAELSLPRAHVAGTASFYADLGHSPRAPRHVQLCDGTACFAARGGRHAEDFLRELEPAKDAPLEGGTSVQPVYCLGYCYGGPAALDGEDPRAGPNLIDQLTGAAEPRDPEIPFRSEVDEPVVMAGIAGDDGDPWVGWHQVLAAGDRGRVIRDVLDAGLRGRGGAGFPAARKWEAAARSTEPSPRYLICNGDEGDPGSYVDRLLMERDPQRVLAGMALVAYATGAERGFVYVRSEYPLARDRLRAAVVEAREEGHLGPDLEGAGTGFDVEVFEGAGSYVAGEETSLIHSIEGLRGDVAVRPPYPTDRGLMHRPTVVNNVETLSAVPWIVARGGKAYHRHGVAGSRGTKVVCLNERFRNPGAYEVELGTSLRAIFEEMGGGVAGGHGVRSIQVGGPLGAFISPEELDTPLSFDALRAVGAELGHGSLIAIDERVSAAALLISVWRFAASESCGTCVPCRVGTRRGLEGAERLAAGEAGLGPEQDRLLETMRLGSLCAFGRGVPQAVRSLVRVYGEELGEAT